MEVTINANTIIALAGVLTALGVIGGAIAWCIRFVDHNKAQDKEIAAQDREIETQREELHDELKAIRGELTVVCYGLLACLKGLKEQGCNGPVTAALDKLEKHLNQAAHDE